MVTVAALALLAAACTSAPPSRPAPTTTPPDVVRADDPVVGAAGDIACAVKSDIVTRGSCQQKATSDLLVAAKPTAVLTLGDEQYDEGRIDGFRKVYAPTWGRLLKITHPAPGNHEYSSGGDGYYQYFGKAAGSPLQPYYSFDLGSWHIVALNSECAAAGGCGHGSRQERWLVADLAAHPNRCTLAFWHAPRFSSGGHGSDAAYSPFWDDLYQAGAEIVLNGHDHSYERFAPQTPSAKAAPERGIREFVVGTGGKNLRPFHTPRANSQVRNAASFGVMLLTLHQDSYDWRFVPIKGSSFTDSGHGTCH